MARALPYFLVYTFPVMLFAGITLGGTWTFLPTVFVVGVIPLADWLVGIDPRTAGPGSRTWFDLPLVLWVPTQLIIIGATIHAVTSGDRSAAEIVGLVFSTGLVTGGAGITIAHELMHRRSLLHRAAAEILMLSVFYPHFCVEHVHGHHRHVGTPRDPATARRGECLWRFLPRTLVGSLSSFLQIESARCRRLGLHPFSLADRRNRYPLALGVIFVLVASEFGFAGTLAFLSIALVAVLLLETINYIEHYGLVRRESAPGKYERVRPAHSWNSAHRVSNVYLFNLARHSDHHFEASRPYDRLRHPEGAPQLPHGYATMLLVALVPRLWFRIMDPHLDAL